MSRAGYEKRNTPKLSGKARRWLVLKVLNANDTDELLLQSAVKLLVQFPITNSRNFYDTSMETIPNTKKKNEKRKKKQKKNIIKIEFLPIWYLS